MDMSREVYAVRFNHRKARTVSLAWLRLKRLQVFQHGRLLVVR